MPLLNLMNEREEKNAFRFLVFVFFQSCKSVLVGRHRVDNQRFQADVPLKNQQEKRIRRQLPCELVSLKSALHLSGALIKKPVKQRPRNGLARRPRAASSAPESDGWKRNVIHRMRLVRYWRQCFDRDVSWIFPPHSLALRRTTGAAATGVDKQANTISSTDQLLRAPQTSFDGDRICCRRQLVSLTSHPQTPKALQLVQIESNSFQRVSPASVAVSSTTSSTDHLDGTA